MKKYFSLSGIVAGVVMVVVGAAFMAGMFTKKLAASFSSNLISYSFGADFYTEMYQASYEIDKSLARVASAVQGGANEITGAVCVGCGLIALAIGLLMIFHFGSIYADLVAAEKANAASSREIVSTAASFANSTDNSSATEDSAPADTPAVADDSATAATPAGAGDSAPAGTPAGADDSDANDVFGTSDVSESEANTMEKAETAD